MRTDLKPILLKRLWATLLGISCTVVIGCSAETDLDSNAPDGSLSDSIIRNHYTVDGVLFGRGELRDSLRVGEWQLFYEDGTVESQGNYIQSEWRNGVWKYYRESGTLQFEKTYLDDTLNGEYLEYTEGETLTVKYLCLNNKIEGSYTEYHHNGSPKYQGDFGQGKGIFKEGPQSGETLEELPVRVGVWSEFDSLGTVINVTKYRPLAHIYFDTAHVIENDVLVEQLISRRYEYMSVEH
jgi:hypothetical protein